MEFGHCFLKSLLTLSLANPIQAQSQTILLPVF